MELTLFILEIIGTVAFAVSGFIAGVNRNLDVLGITIMAVVTAVGGGAIRDITLGITPPTFFVKPIYLCIALLTCLIFFIGAEIWRRRADRNIKMPKNIVAKAINISDAIGLGVFTVSGASVAMAMGYGDNFVLILFVGPITGVGGGIMRDVFTGQIPSVFVRHIYALASLIGAATLFGLQFVMDQKPAMLLCTALIVAIRILSSHFQLSLPKIKR